MARVVHGQSPCQVRKLATRANPSPIRGGSVLIQCGFFAAALCWGDAPTIPTAEGDDRFNAVNLAESVERQIKIGVGRFVPTNDDNPDNWACLRIRLVSCAFW